MKKTIVSMATAMLCASVSAQNLGFETGDATDWTVINGSLAPKTTWNGNGSGASVISEITALTQGGMTWKLQPYGNKMLALQAGGAGGTFDQMATNLGLSASSVTELKSILTQQAQATGQGQGNPTNAAWAKTTINVQAGDIFKMSWNYTSTDYVPFNDGSITTLVDPTNATNLAKINGQLKQYALLGFTNQGTGDYSTGSYGSTGWQIANYEIINGGQYVLGFASFNLDDTALSPILLVDNQNGYTYKNGTLFGPVAPNPGTTAPNNTGAPAPTPTPTPPTVVSTVQDQVLTTGWSAQVAGAGVMTTVRHHDASDNGKVQTIAVKDTNTTVTPMINTASYNLVETKTWSDGTTTTSVVGTGTAYQALNPNTSVAEVDQPSYVGRVDQMPSAVATNRKILTTMNFNNVGYMNYDAKKNGMNGSSNGFVVGGMKYLEGGWSVGAGVANFAGGLSGTDGIARSTTNAGSLMAEQKTDDVTVDYNLGIGFSDLTSARTIGPFNNSSATKSKTVFSQVKVTGNEPLVGDIRPVGGVGIGYDQTNGYVESGSIQSAREVGKQTDRWQYAFVGGKWVSGPFSAEVIKRTDNVAIASVAIDHELEDNKNVYLRASYVDGSELRGLQGQVGLRIKF
jgi:hypothetical protein